MTVKNLFVLLAVIVAASCSQPHAHTFGASGGTPSPIIPASWTVAAWFIDPANVSGTASDSNNCTTSSTPCLTWHQINDVRWGCQGSPIGCPRLAQATTVTFESSQSGNSDPIYFTPTNENGGQITFQGNLGVAQQAFTGTLNTVTAKNRNTPQLLKSTFTTTTGAIAVGEFLVNSTHSSAAWVYASLGAGAFSITQPQALSTLPFGGNPTAEVDTWTTGDAIIGYNQVAANIVVFNPILSNFNSSVSGLPTIFQLSILDPQPLFGDNWNPSSIGKAVQLVELGATRGVTVPFSPYYIPVQSIANNVWFQGGLSTPGSSVPQAGTYGIEVAAGAVGSATNGFQSMLSNVLIDHDTILTMRGGGTVGLNNGGTGTAYIDTSTILALQGADALTAGATNILWGPGGINLLGQARAVYPSGAGGAAAAFKITGTLSINSKTTNACSVVLSTGVWTCTNAVTAAQLDTVAGASLGGLSNEPGGASFSNGSL